MIPLNDAMIFRTSTSVSVVFDVENTIANVTLGTHMLLFYVFSDRVIHICT